MLGIDLAKEEDCTVLTLSNGSNIRLLRNKSTNVRGLRSKLMSLLCIHAQLVVMNFGNSLI